MRFYESSLPSSAEWKRAVVRLIDFTNVSTIIWRSRLDDNTCDWNFEVFKLVANELYRLMKQCGVIIWVVGDKTQDGSDAAHYEHTVLVTEDGYEILTPRLD